MTSQHGTHNDLHSEQGALSGEHPGRARNPVIKVRDLAWLEFVKPDLAASERFARAFGFTTVSRSADELLLRGTDAGAPSVIVRRGPRSRYLGAAFRAVDSSDVARLADATGSRVETLPEHLGGLTVDLTDPSGVMVRVVADTHELGSTAPADRGVQLRARGGPRQHHAAPAACPREDPATGPRGPADHEVHRDPGLVPAAPGSDRERLQVLPGPARAGPHDELHPLRRWHDTHRPPHPGDDARPQQPVRALGLPGGRPRRTGGRRRVPARAGFQRSWGIGRHIEGSQIFDYWRDPDGLLVEHYADGDLFDSTLEPGWSPMTASGLAQWGPPATKDFLGLLRDETRCTSWCPWPARCATTTSST